jgi:hypothetical protein
MKNAITAFALAMCLSVNLRAQNQDPAHSQSGGPPPNSWAQLFFYINIGGADYLQYTCYARTNQQSLSVGITQIVDTANTSTLTAVSPHGLAVNNKVTLSGITGGGSALNGAQTVTAVPSATTFQIATSGIADATYNNAGITAASSAPRTSREIWAIKKNSYGGTGGTSLISVQWAVKSGSATSSTGQAVACDDRESLAYQ